MDLEKGFYYHLESLGQLPSRDGREHALGAVFGALKSIMSPEQAHLMEISLPPWLKAKWLEEYAVIKGVDNTDVIGLIQLYGDYAYRGAAERILRAVFGSLVEVLEQTAKERLSESLPQELSPYWKQAQACSLGETIGQHL